MYQYLKIKDDSNVNANFDPVGTPYCKINLILGEKNVKLPIKLNGF